MQKESAHQAQTQWTLNSTYEQFSGSVWRAQEKKPNAYLKDRNEKK
jgi:hypothetical protein